ncbi:MAG TPA: VWA domain-containing protein [Pyrinomonadaceae bacterium]|nr:VWA domain-containing protein [Pyrinomonadaceae bacterium]
MSYPFRARPAARPLLSLTVTVATLVVLAAPVRAQRAGAADEVRLIVTVSDSGGRYITNLEKSRFSILEGKEAREITSFDAADAPANVGVVVDVSESMIRRGDEIKVALRQLVIKGHPENRYFIAEFNTQGRLLSDWTSDRAVLEGSIQQIGATLGRARVKGYTSLYDACADALTKLAEGPHDKGVLVVISDGMDTHSRVSLRELRSRILASEVLVYSLGPTGGVRNALDEVAGKAVLADMATQTGGVALFPESRKEAVAAGEWIAADLRSQYVVGFAPGQAAGVASEPKWRKIKIRVDSLSKEIKIVVRSREGYFFPRPVN